MKRKKLEETSVNTLEEAFEKAKQLKEKYSNLKTQIEISEMSYYKFYFITIWKL